MNLENRMNMVHLVWPIMIQTFLSMLFMSVDVLMLSGFSDEAVAGVGVMNRLGQCLVVLYMMVSTGTTIVISQYNGAGKTEESGYAVSSGIVLSAVFGIVISLVMAVSAVPLVSLFKVAPAVRGYALEYITVYGAFSFCIAMNIEFSTVLRTYGFTREPMIVMLIANVCNAAGNYCFLFGPLGIPVLGVSGVALSTIVSNGLGALVLFFMIIRHREIQFSLNKLFIVPGRIYKEILRLGVPNGGEFLSFQLSQMAILYIISLMGTSSLTSYSYANSVTRFIFMFSISIGSAAQILSGYMVGRKQFEKCRRGVLRWFYTSFGIALMLSLIVFLFRIPLISVFTDNQEIITITSSLIFFSIFIETGRAFNMVIIGGLKGSGDVHFPVRMGIVFMWGVAVLFSYIFGIRSGFGIVGIWMAISMDEWSRGLVMYIRWRSGVWQHKGIKVGVQEDSSIYEIVPEQGESC